MNFAVFVRQSSLPAGSVVPTAVTVVIVSIVVVVVVAVVVVVVVDSSQRGTLHFSHLIHLVVV